MQIPEMKQEKPKITKTTTQQDTKRRVTANDMIPSKHIRVSG